MTKIMVYDADPSFRESMKSALAVLGYEAVIAANGYDVLPLAAQHQPGLFILDYKLPEAAGFDILQRLRGTQAFAATPVVFASVTPKFEIEMTVMDAPAVGYIDKPLDAGQLKQAIEFFLGSPAAAEPEPEPEPGNPSAPSFNGEPDLDGVRADVIDLD